MVQPVISFLGHIFVNKNKEYIFGASQILYYAFTTLSKLQTLGEEYTKIVQVGKTGRHVPGFLVSERTREHEINEFFHQIQCCRLQQSTCMVLAHVFGDQLIFLALNRFIDSVQTNQTITLQAKDQIVRTATTVKSLVPLFQSLNRVLFYWNGSFYTWAKRFFNITYVSDCLDSC